MRVERAMADDPADRYATASEFHQALGEIKPIQVDWKHVAPHSGHEFCWLGSQRTGGQDLTVCVSRASTGLEYETRKAEGSKQRVRDYCGIAKDGRTLRVALREVFDSVS
jgi:eukaryotic-like serine/threonine-protein kinase